MQRQSVNEDWPTVLLTLYCWYVAAAPESRPPDRTRQVSSAGLAISVSEWGQESDRPLLLAHGTGDSSRTFDAFAPLLAHEGWRVSRGISGATATPPGRPSTAGTLTSGILWR